MANYSTLKAAIQQVIKANGNNEITGDLLQQSLLAMINSLGSGYQFVGVADTSTNPGTPDQRVFYIGGVGSYPNFGGLNIYPGNLGVLKFDGSWHVETINVAGYIIVSNNGWFLVDNDFNVAMKYDAEGLDVAKISEHFNNLIGGTLDYELV